MSELLERDTLVVSQKAKLVELTNEYRILDEQGTELGAIRQEGQSAARKAFRLVSSLDQFLTHKLAVYDRTGAKVLELVRPRKLMKSRVEVTDGMGQPAGRIVQQNLIGKIRFAFEGPSGEQLGSINAENWRAWDFSIQDPMGQEVARVTKKWRGILREGFTTADSYVVNVSAPVSAELRMMVLAAAAAIDTTLKQDDS
ncbi:MAG: LURP-one-related/scramblase family protein [Gaiellaceae bacterium]